MTLENILADFQLLDDWEDRYRYVIELGRALPPLPEAARTEANRVRGCAIRPHQHLPEDPMPKDAHNKAAEHHENAAKSHRAAAEQHGKSDHAKGKENANAAKQHSQTAHQHSDQAHSKS